MSGVAVAEPAVGGGVPRYRAYRGYQLFANGFRPFFLLGAIQAGLAILVWLPVFYGELALASAFAPRDWHVHEMLYGYLPAIITGFLFTAIPNWTGRLPLQGAPLAMLVAVWIAGRLAVTFSATAGWWVAMLIDASFLLLVAAAAAREIAAGRNWKNLNVVALVVLLLAGNVAFHLEARFHGAADFGIRAGIAVVVLLISLIGGRIIPSFTRNWLVSTFRSSQNGSATSAALVRENPSRLPAPFGRFDIIVVALGALALVSWIVSPDSRIAGAALGAAGLLHLVRLSRWAGDRTFGERLLTILHVGYFFVPLGFLLNAAAAFGFIPQGAGIHAWMAGAAGIMTLAVMTRASLGHTGNALTASAGTQAIYAAIIVSAVARICAVFHGGQSDLLLHVAALAWVTAFLGFALAYGPLLVRRVPRVQST